jgi:hypothetical protein
MAGEHNDAISRVGDLIVANMPFNSICCVVQARASRATSCRISPLIFPAGIHVSSCWELAHGGQQLRGRDSIVRTCRSPNTTSHESTALGGVTGKLSNGYNCNVSKLATQFVRYLDGNLMISISRFDSTFVKHFMRQVARRRQASLFSEW